MADTDKPKDDVKSTDVMGTMHKTVETLMMANKKDGKNRFT